MAGLVMARLVMARLVMRALLAIGVVCAMAGGAGARSVVRSVKGVTPIILPSFEPGCGADGKLTPELRALKLQGAANLEPCKPGSMIFLSVTVAGKRLVGFVAHVAGMKVGRLYVGDRPMVDERELVKTLGGAKKLKKLSDQDAGNVLMVVAAVKANLVHDFFGVIKASLQTDFPDARARLQSEGTGYHWKMPDKRRELVGFAISQPASLSTCQLLSVLRVTLTSAGALSISAETVGRRGCK